MATFSAPAAKEHVKGLRAQIVHRADQEFPFLHDTMIVPLGGRLLMAWYNCSENEIVGRTIIRGRWSADHGQTWSEPEIICEDVRPEHHMVPVTFTEENGEIWAYVTRMSSHDRPRAMSVCSTITANGSCGRNAKNWCSSIRCRRKRTASGSPEAEWRRSRASFL